LGTRIGDVGAPRRTEAPLDPCLPDHILVTMIRKMTTIAAGQFKARCLALLDEVAATGKPILVTKRGKPVAKVVPADGNGPASLLGSVVREDDIVSPITAAWHVNR
jgi:prevent-host-death family protein